MIRFRDLSVGQRMERKKFFFGGFCVEMYLVFRRNLGARYLIGKYQRIITFRLWSEVIVFF